jgi:hypothetical protein
MPSRTADGGRRRICERGGLRTNSRARRSPGACSRDLWAGCRSHSSSVSQRYLGRRVWEPDWFTGPPGRDLDLQCRAAEGVADDRQLRSTVDDQLGCRFAVRAGEHIERDAHPNPLGIFWARTRFADLSTVSELRKHSCAILGLKAWRVETPGLRCPGCYLGRSTRPRNPRLTAHSDLALASVGLVQRRQYTGTRCENGTMNASCLTSATLPASSGALPNTARDAGSAAAPTMRQPKPKHNSGVGAKSKGTR